MIPQETVNKILDTAQIVDVISDFVTLKRHGKEYACNSEDGNNDLKIQILHYNLLAIVLPI